MAAGLRHAVGGLMVLIHGVVARFHDGLNGFRGLDLLLDVRPVVLLLLLLVFLLMDVGRDGGSRRGG